MKSVRIVVLSVFVCLVGCLVACQNPESSLTPPMESGKDILPYVNSVQADIYLVAKHSTLMSDSGGPYESQEQRIYCYDGGGNPISPVSASVNSNSLGVAPGAVAGTAALPWAGSNHIWTFNGGASLPSFTDTLVAPSKLSITSPSTNLDSISSSGVTVLYSGAGTDSVYLELRYDRLVSKRLDSTSPNVTWFKRFARANSGSAVLSSSDLSGMPSKGMIRLSVYAPKTKVSTKGSKTVALVAYNVATSMHFIK